MTEKIEQLQNNLQGQTMRELQDLWDMRKLQDQCEHILDVLVKNARTDTLVYGWLRSLVDESKRGITRKTLKKEMKEAIELAYEKFHYLFFPDDETKKGGDE